MTSYRTALLTFALIGVAFGLYANTLGHDFVFDDRKYIVPNTEIRSIAKLANILNPFARGGSGYRPMRNLSLAIDYSIWTMEPFGFHLTNCLLHVLVCLAVARLALLLFKDRRVGWCTAFLFASHPIQTEAVTYISGRKDLLTALFFVLGWIAFLHHRRRQENGGSLWVPVVFLCLGASLLSKEMGITLPVVLFLWDLTFGDQAKQSKRPIFSWIGQRTVQVFRRYWVFYGSFAVILAGAVFLLLVVIPSTNQTYWGGTLWTNLLTAARIQVHYLKLLVFPVTLIGDYSLRAFPITTEPFDLGSIASLVGVVLLIGCCAIGLRRFPRLCFLGLAYFVTLLPVAQIKPHHELVGERFLYLPALFFAGVTALLSVTLVDRLLDGQERWQSARDRILAGAIGLLLLVYGIRTVVRTGDWKDDLTFWNKVIQDAPECARAHRNLAYNLFQSGKHEEAIASMQTCLQILPEAYITHYNLAVMYERTGRIEAAIYEYRMAFGGRREREGAHLNLALLLARLQRLDEAEEVLLDLTMIKPNLGEAYYNLGVLCEQEGREQEAEEYFQMAKYARHPYPK